jgi:hypothetical protein
MLLGSKSQFLRSWLFFVSLYIEHFMRPPEENTANFPRTAKPLLRNYRMNAMEINKKPVRLLRIAIAAVLSELIPLIILVVILTVYGYMVTPGPNQEFSESFVKQAGKYTGPIAGTLATLGMAFWAARNQTHTWLLHGALTGILVVLLDLAIYTSQPENFDLVFGLGLPAKFLAGVLGGFLAKRRYQNLPPEERESHRLI